MRTNSGKENSVVPHACSLRSTRRESATRGELLPRYSVRAPSFGPRASPPLNPPSPPPGPSHAQAKTTKKVTIRLECKDCKTKKQLVLKRCKHFELGEKKKGSGPSY